MKTKFVQLCVAVLLSAPMAQACGLSPQLYTKLVLSTNEVAASNAIAMLRNAGKQGLDALLQAHAALIARHDEGDAQWKKLRAALDAVGRQRDCHASRLFWHTDFDAAKAEAQRLGRPILSLRLLGNLDEELSCANSRFFRTTLYANREVSDYLRDHFVLHWKSVRPVPHITVDFGDGRKMERTITGNSIHYVLDMNGKVVDALPGLYGARAFLDNLKLAEPMAIQASKGDPAVSARWLETYHLVRLRDINQRWSFELSQTGLEPRPVSGPVANAAAKNPPAAAAMPLAAGKAAVEMPMLRALAPTREELANSMNDQRWSKVAALHTNDVVLDENVVALIRSKNPFGPDASRMEEHILGREYYFRHMISALKQSLAEDTVRNEYGFHAKIHEWLATPGSVVTLESLNSRVYAELFLTPESDPWLGLAPRNAFSALENGGLTQR